MRPDVLVYQELPNIIATPVTPDLEVCVVGPAYHIKTYEHDKSDIQVSDYGITVDSQKIIPAPLPPRVQLTDPPDNELGAVIDPNQLVIYFDDVYVAVQDGGSGRAAYGSNRFYDPNATFSSDDDINAVIGDKLVAQPSIINLLEDLQFSFLDVDPLTDKVSHMTYFGIDGGSTIATNVFSSISLFASGRPSIIPNLDKLIILGSEVNFDPTVPGNCEEFTIIGWDETVNELYLDNNATKTDGPLYFFISRHHDVSSVDAPDVATVIPQSYTGNVLPAGDVLEDINARFQTLGVQAGDYLVIETGVNKGSYRLFQVGDKNLIPPNDFPDTRISLVGVLKFPVFPLEPITYHIERRIYNKLFVESDSPFMPIDLGAPIDAGIVGIKETVGGQLKLTELGAFTNTAVGNYCLVYGPSGTNTDDNYLYRVIQRDDNYVILGTGAWTLEEGGVSWAICLAPVADTNSDFEYSVGNEINSFGNSDLNKAKSNGINGNCTTEFSTEKFTSVGATFVTDQVKPGDYLLIMTAGPPPADDNVGFHKISEVIDEENLYLEPGTWVSIPINSERFSVFSWGYDNHMLDINGNLILSTTGQRLNPDTNGFQITDIGDPGASTSSPNVNTDTVLYLSTGMTFPANELFPADWRVEHQLDDQIIPHQDPDTPTNIWVYVDSNNYIYIGGDDTNDRQVSLAYLSTNRKTVVGAKVYVQYRSLMQQLSNMVRIDGNFNPTEGLEHVGRVVENNPGACGCQKALDNTNSHIYFLGIAADSDSGYADALDTLESKNIYCLIPCTNDSSVLASFKTHCEQMSMPEKGKFRIFIGSGILPEFKIIVDTNTDGYGEEDPLNPDRDILYDANGMFISSGVSVGDEVEVLSPPDDGSIPLPPYYVYAIMSEERIRINKKWNGDHGSAILTYKVRRALTKQGQIDDLELVSKSYNSNRAVMVWPGSCDFDDMYGNRMTNLPGYNLAAAVGGMVAGWPAHKPFTKLAIAGIDQIRYSNDYFKDDQLDELTEAGWYVVVQDTVNSLPYCIRQYTTDITSVETAELSVVKTFDYVSLFFKRLFTPFIGVWNLNDDTITTMLNVFASGVAFLQRKKYPKIGQLLLHAKVTGIDPPGTISTDRFDMYVEIGLPVPYNFLGLHLIAA